MKYKVFDVVMLHNGKKATILGEINKEQYKAEVVNNNGETEGVMQINDSDIKDIILKK